jgi:ferrous iron transport protein B
VTKTREVGIPISGITVRHKARQSIAIIGNPNSGKSTLFNRLTGLRQTTGNYPGVTVEKHVGTAELNSGAVELIDLPGIYCLGGHSTDEQIAVDVLLGRIPDTKAPQGLVVVVDATHLYQGLYLVEQLLEMQLPTMVALSMVDVARVNGVDIDTDALSSYLGGIDVIPVTATTGQGLDALRESLATLNQSAVPDLPQSWPELSREAQLLANDGPEEVNRMDVIQGLLHPNSKAELELGKSLTADKITETRRKLFGSSKPQAVEARKRYSWAANVVRDVQTQAPLLRKFGAKLERWVSSPWPATMLFFLTLILVFQAVFSWAAPVMEAIDGFAGSLGHLIKTNFGDTMFTSFVADGVISGVGSVVVFLPQILILFLFIIILEDTGYLARAAFLMDRAMRKVGLSGQSVIPMLSSFACAVPAIMATRVIPNRRDRISTILAAPFMTCSARLPIYALLIAAFIPNDSIGWFNLQGLVLFGMYLLGIVGGLVTARIMKSSALRGPKPQFTLALPDFRRPNLQTVMIKLMDRAKIFLKRAGTVIFTVAVIVWALAYFPRMESGPVSTNSESGQVRENQQAAAQMSQSYLGRMGRVLEPVFKPLGWDWKVSSAVIAGFPAREVVVAVMGTLYAVGSEADDSSLSEKLRAAKWPDGRYVFTLPMVLGLMVFYAWCLQCAATVAVIRRETNTWRWPIFAWTYMTVVAYLGALAVFQIGSRFL